MLGSFLDQVTKVFGRRFLLTVWIPVFLVATFAAVPIGYVIGLERLVRWWNRQDGLTQGMLPLLALLVITGAAYLLQSIPTASILTGSYWLSTFRKPMTKLERRRWERMGQKLDQRRYYEMPRNAEHLVPTRFGNALRAAETYPYSTYGLDGSFWWTRLTPLLKEEDRTTLDDALTPVIGLANTALLTALVLPPLLIAVVLGSDSTTLLTLTFFVGYAVQWISYRAATAQAMTYGDLVRSTYDIHRDKLFVALRLARPPDLRAEWATWTKLQRWLFDRIPPIWVSPSNPPIEYLERKDDGSLVDPERVQGVLAAQTAGPKRTPPKASEANPLPRWSKVSGGIRPALGLVGLACVAWIGNSANARALEKVLVARYDTQSFSIAKSATRCASVSFADSDALGCESHPSELVIVRNRSAGDYLRCHDVIRLREHATTSPVVIPTGSPQPVGGEAAWILGEDGKGNELQVDGIALGDDGGTTVVAVPTEKVRTLITGLQASPQTLTAIRALGVEARTDPCPLKRQRREDTDDDDG